tara:strand:- start:69 stop:278 length:210 start_codon:yes stop_codon:yes gene_type:complete
MDILETEGRERVQNRLNNKSDHVMTLCGYGTTWNNVSSSVKKCEIIPELLTDIFARKFNIPESLTYQKV